MGAKPFGKSVVSPVTGCITAQVGEGFTGGAFKKEAVNCTCCAGFNPTGTVAVVGVTETRIPESNVITAVPVFFLSASALAVKVNWGIGLGKLLSVGAVYVRTLVAAVGVSVQVPTVPPFSDIPLVHGPVTAFGFGCAVVGNGVYEYVHAKVEVVVVDPVTVDENV